jgi:UDP-N-acetylglucosamine 2-epimerase (non-hydrolysing)
LMSDVFFRDLGIPSPNVNLSVGSGKHGAQTGAMMSGLEPVFEQFSPDWVLVYGDTNSTLAAAVTAVKLHLPLAHLEAGLRSFNRRMPEEHNRILTDHAADLCLAPTNVAMNHLSSEGLADRSVLVGDVMTDVLYRIRDQISGHPLPLPPDVTAGGYYLATLHRAENTDDRERLSAIVAALAKLEHPVLLLVHPRLGKLADQYGISLNQGLIRAIPPLAYPDLVNAAGNSRGVITDSGGLQKEAFLLRVPCTTLRSETEWVETVELGWNKIVSSDLDDLPAIVESRHPAPTDAQPYGDGHAALKVADILLGTGPTAPARSES